MAEPALQSIKWKGLEYSFPSFTHLSYLQASHDQGTPDPGTAQPRQPVWPCSISQAASRLAAQGIPHLPLRRPPAVQGQLWWVDTHPRHSQQSILRGRSRGGHVCLLLHRRDPHLCLSATGPDSALLCLTWASAPPVKGYNHTCIGMAAMVTGDTKSRSAL